MIEFMNLQNIGREFRLYFICSLFLILFSFGLTAYRRLLLGQYPLDLDQNGYGVVESLILAKLIVIGQHFNLGTRFDKQPLAIPTFYKTLVFSLFVFLFHILEHFVLGLIHGRPLGTLYFELTDQRLEEIALKSLIQFFAFILLFAFLELGRVLGEDKLFNLFFRRRSS
jgi:hypothetical protein